MDEPFREPAEIIPRVDAKTAMDKLDAAEPVPFSFRLATSPLGLYWPAAGDPVGSRQTRELAEKLGFKPFGRMDFVSTFFTKLPREVWIDEKSGIVMLTLRRAAATGVIEKQMSIYNFETMFDDGSVVITWSRPDVELFEKNPRVLDLAGTENIATDYETHLRAVAKQSEKGARALQITDMETALRVKAWDDSRLRPASIQIRLRARMLLLGFVLSVIWVLFRRFA